MHRSPKASLCAVAVLAPLVFTLVGCGSSHELETARVKGHVTIDGVPATSGYVMVLPKKGRMAKGAIEQDGTFVLGTYRDSDGAQVGQHAAVVTPVPSDEGGPRVKGGPKIPRRYHSASSSRLTVKVEPGGLDDWHIELSSSKKQ
ncbi:MAG: hypothetical protein AAGJ46_01820 [Planctomycetota bacterium]